MVLNRSVPLSMAGSSLRQPSWHTTCRRACRGIGYQAQGLSILCMLLFSLLFSCGCQRQDAEPPAKAEKARSSRKEDEPSHENALEEFREGAKYALLVGVGRYEPESGLNPLHYAEKDVEELAELLQASGYRKRNVTLMTHSRASKDGSIRYLPLEEHVRAELKLLLKDLSQRDEVLLALAGHGIKYKDDEKSYFCPIDAKVEERQNLIALDDVYALLRESRAARKVLLCDACRNEPFKTASRAPASATRPETPPPPGGVAALYACSAGERAFEHPELEHGVFFYYVLEGLRGKADLDGDSIVQLFEAGNIRAHAGQGLRAR